MEQLIYTSSGRGERAGYQVCARSPALRPEDSVTLEGVFGFHGPPPKEFPVAGVFSFLEYRVGQFCAWQTYRREGSKNDSRRTLWIHGYVFGQDELEAMQNDPFALVDAKLFQQPSDSIPTELPQSPPPPPRGGPKIADLFSLKPLEVDVFCASLLCKQHCYLLWHGLTMARMRALQALVPGPLRRRLTFYGMVSGSPHLKAKVIFSPQALALGESDTSCSAAASVEDGRYKGDNPSPYACAIAEYIKAKDSSGLRAFIHFAETMGDDVLASGGRALVTLYAQGQEFIEKRAVEELVRCCHDLSQSASKEAVHRFRNGVLLSIVERALEDSALDGLEPALIEMVRSGCQFTSSETKRFADSVRAIWRAIPQHPTLLPVALRIQSRFRNVGQAELDGFLDSAEDVAELLRSEYVVNPERRVSVWKDIVYAADECGEKAIAEWASANAVVDALACPSLLPTKEICECLTRVRSPESARLVQTSLLKTKPCNEHKTIVRHLLREASVAKSCSELRPWIAWAHLNERTWEAVRGELFARCKGEKALLQIIEDSCRNGELDALRAFATLQGSRADAAQANLARRFARALPADQRVCVAITVLRQSEETAAREILAPRNGREAIELEEAVHLYLPELTKKEKRFCQRLIHKYMQQFVPLDAVGANGSAKTRKRLLRISLVLAGLVTVVILILAHWYGKMGSDLVSSDSAPIQVDTPRNWKGDISRSRSSGVKLDLYGHKVAMGRVIAEAAIIRNINTVRDAWKEVHGSVERSSEPDAWALQVVSLLSLSEGHVLLKPQELAEARQKLVKVSSELPVPEWKATAEAPVPDWYGQILKEKERVGTFTEPPPKPLTMTAVSSKTGHVWREWHEKGAVDQRVITDAGLDESEEEVLMWARWATQDTGGNAAVKDDQDEPSTSKASKPSVQKPDRGSISEAEEDVQAGDEPQTKPAQK